MFYFVKTPWWLKRIYDSYIWDVDSKEKSLYLTFDDGPHPVATPFVLEQLKKYNALATFFCIGKNVITYPEIYEQIRSVGHALGNHTFDHLNGWKTDDKKYLENVAKASEYIESSLFRPPYGKITALQAKGLKTAMKGKDPKVIMWDVISGDFDTSITPAQCLGNVIFSSKPGSIVVFHDSEKAYKRLEYVLPRVLKFYSGEGYQFKSL